VIGPNSITTAEILNGTIRSEDVTTIDSQALTSAQVRNETLMQEDLGENAVGSSEIADGAVTTDHLAGGSVTTDKQRANAAQSLSGSSQLVVPIPGLSATDSSTAATIDIAGGSHVVLVSGQAQFVGDPAGGEVITVSVQLFEGATPISPEYSDQITATDPTLTLSVSALLPSAVLPPASPGVHTYTLKLTASSAALSAPRTVNATNVQVRAIDLGR
jgi:hypothetical protein